MGRWKTVLLSRTLLVPVIVMLTLIAVCVFYYRSAIRKSETAVNERSFRVLAGLAEELSNRLATLEKLGHNKWSADDWTDLRDLVPYLRWEEACHPELWKDPQRKLRLTDSDSTLHIVVGILPEVPARSRGSSAPASSSYATPAITNVKVRTNSEPTSSCWSYSLDSLMRLLEDSLPKGIFDDLLLTDSSGRILYQTQRSGMKIGDLHALLEEAEQRENKAREKPEEQRTTVGKKNQLAVKIKAGSAGDDKDQEQKSVQKADDLTMRLANSRLSDVHLGGEPYKLYTIPVPIPVLDEVSAPFTFIVGGILHESAFNEERRKPLYNTLVTIGLVLLFLATATYPILKLRLIGPVYVLKPGTGFVFVLQVVFATLLVGGLAGHRMFSRYQEQTDKVLQPLADTIEGNLAAETHHALDVLAGLENFYANEPRAKLVGDKNLANKTCLGPDGPEFKPKPEDWIREVLNPEEANNLKMTNLKKIKAEIGKAVTEEYPYFDHVYFADQAGNEEIKFSARHFVGPGVRVCDTEGFKQALRGELGGRFGDKFGDKFGDLWRLRSWPDAGAFRVDPTYSTTSGRYLAFISRPTLNPKLKERVLAAVIGTTWVSVSQPVFPPDYGFAVVDRAGKVLFHSTPAKNGRENFADACDRSRRLHDLIEMRESEPLETFYLGIHHRVWVQPIREFEHCPWSIITFRDLTSWDEDHFDSVQLFFFLSGSYFVILVIAGWLSGFAKRPPSWIWPARRARQAYWGIFWVLILVNIFNLFWLFPNCDGTQLWVTACTIPLVAAATAILKLRSKNWIICGVSAMLWLLVTVWTLRHDPAFWHFWLPFTCICAAFSCLALPLERLSLKTPRLANVYALLATVLLFTIGLIPALRLFNASVLFQDVAAVRRSQLELADQLGHRQRLISDAYSGTYGDEESARQNYFDQRRGEKLDRYYPDLTLSAAGHNLQLHRPEPLLSFISSNVFEHDGNSLRHRSGLRSSDGWWDWCEDREFPIPTINMLRAVSPEQPCSVQNGDMAVDYPNGWIASTLPQKVDADAGASFWAVVIMLGTTIGSFFALRDAIKRLFVLDWRPPEPWPEVELPHDLDLSDRLPFGRYAVLLGAPRSGKTAALKSWRGIKYINLANDPLSWTKPESVKVVVLDHFEHLLNNSSDWQREVLERLIYEAESVIIVTTVDPKYYFDCLAKRKDLSYDESGDSLDIEGWTKVLARFHVVRATNPSLVQGDEYFALLWRTCSDEERLALRQIAVYGWANYRQKPAMTHLFQRGLLTHERKFKVTDPSQPGGVGAESDEAESRFARYLRHSFKTRHLVIPEEHGTADLGVLRIVIGVVFIVLAAALAYVWGDQVVSYVVAGAGAVTPAIRAFARSKAPGSGSVNA